MKWLILGIVLVLIALTVWLLLRRPGGEGAVDRGPGGDARGVTGDAGDETRGGTAAVDAPRDGRGDDGRPFDQESRDLAAEPTDYAGTGTPDSAYGEPTPRQADDAATDYEPEPATYQDTATGDDVQVEDYAADQPTGDDRSGDAPGRETGVEHTSRAAVAAAGAAGAAGMAGVAAGSDTDDDTHGARQDEWQEDQDQGQWSGDRTAQQDQWATSDQTAQQDQWQADQEQRPWEDEAGAGGTGGATAAEPAYDGAAPTGDYTDSEPVPAEATPTGEGHDGAAPTGDYVDQDHGVTDQQADDARHVEPGVVGAFPEQHRGESFTDAGTTGTWSEDRDTSQDTSDDRAWEVSHDDDQRHRDGQSGATDAQVPVEQAPADRMTVGQTSTEPAGDTQPWAQDDRSQGDWGQDRELQADRQQEQEYGGGDYGYDEAHAGATEGSGFGPGPYGPGSALPMEDGSGPGGWSVKGNSGSMLFHTPESPSYDNVRAEVWFESEDAARSAGFAHWDRKRR